MANPLLDLDFGIWGIVGANVALGLFALLFFALALAVGALTGNRGLTVGLSAAVTAGLFFVNGFAPLIDEITWMQKITPYFLAPGSQPPGQRARPAGNADLRGGGSPAGGSGGVGPQPARHRRLTDPGGTDPGGTDPGAPSSPDVQARRRPRPAGAPYARGMRSSQVVAAVLVVVVLGALGASRLGSDSGAGSTPGPDGADRPATSEGAGSAPERPAAEARSVVQPPPVLDPKPALTDLDGWLNTGASSLDDFAGQVRVVEFWTFGCINCKNRLPHTQELYATFRPRGLEIIAVHAPEFDHERDPAAVAEASERLGIEWPVALDTRKTNFRAWQGDRRFWPRVYVLDQNGDVRYDHIGEGDYDGLTETVAYLIDHGP